MDTQALRELAQLLAERNAIDARIAARIGRPALPGHIGEWIASQVFDIELARSAATRSLDGWFRGAPRPGATVNVKLYGKREGLLDLTPEDPPEFYLVLTGPLSAAVSSRAGHRPVRIDAVYLFETRIVIADIRERAAARGRSGHVGTASSVRKELWEQSEVFPRSKNSALVLTDQQVAALAPFATHDPNK